MVSRKSNDYLATAKSSTWSDLQVYHAVKTCFGAVRICEVMIKRGYAAKIELNFITGQDFHVYPQFDTDDLIRLGSLRRKKLGRRSSLPAAPALFLYQDRGMLSLFLATWYF
ncbi:hypothetical protein HYALB_00006111 [Hymenoscyphus albidus]|uniref:Uncharacterized protein n=1 Tax=Hymenoscyphus albidus TaxID=595503 RepID=A0A9N9Q251_9HELO|nr:hypothetical protein HYALB_00006111 [Hymenoscyphus albidus]